MKRTTIIAISLVCWLTALPVLAGGNTKLFGPRNPDAPNGVDQFGRFEGRWTCAPASRQPDGTMQTFEARPTWVWHYALNGHAIQDVWIPDPENSPPGAAMGTNLRVYDKDSDEWLAVWTTETMGGIQTFAAKQENGNIVMRGDIEAGVRPAHMARITFHNISDSHFDWKYEASGPNDGVNWQVFSTLACDRI